jgi:hypothetical protein
MPNSNLPIEVKDITSFKVLVTQHTEEDVDMMIAQKYIDCLNLKDEFLNIASAELGKIIDTNPYKDHDFKTPLEDSKIPWLVNKSEQYMRIVHLRNDFTRCSKIFKKDYPQIEELDDFVNKMVTYAQDYQFYEKNHRRNAYLSWRDKKAKLKKDDKLKNPHKYHMSIQDWDLKIISDPDCAKMLDGPEKYAEVMACPLCIEVEVKRIEKMTERDNIPKHIQEQEEQEENEECEDCGFIGKSYAFERHLNHTTHLTAVHLRNLYCEKCELQCRTEKELQIHCKTARHVNASKVMKDVTYSCEKCNYSTPHKHVYQIHCKSKKHNC